MKKKILITILSVAIVLVVILSGCTENVRTKPIATEYSKVVSSNGGMAVVYGDYLYFINGYAGDTVDNTFGKVVKGAIARVKLSSGKPQGKAQIIVPKNVYGTDTKHGGIYIDNNYIYYASTSTDLDGQGQAKIDNMVILRTKVDGTDTETVAKFGDHDVVFRVWDGKLVYIRENGIFSIDLSDKKFTATTVEEQIADTNYLFNDEFLFYTVYNDGNSADYILKVYQISTGQTKAIIDSKMLDSTEKTLYTLSLLSVMAESEQQVTLFYTKTDNGINTPEVGVYSYTFDTANFSFDKSKEIRFTRNKNDTANLAYTKFYKVADYYLGLDASRFDVFNKDGSRLTTTAKDGEEISAKIDVGSDISFFDIEYKQDSIDLWYQNSSVIYKIKIFDKIGDGYKFIDANAIKVFSGSYDTAYVSLEKIGNIIYYFNSDVSSNAYYFDLSAQNAENDDTAKGKILGIITEKDIIEAF